MARANKALPFPPGYPIVGAFLTRGRRRGGHKSKSTHSGGLLGDQLLAVGAHFALFVLEQSERLVSVGLRPPFPTGERAGTQEHAGNTSPLGAEPGLWGWQPLRKKRENPGPCKDLEDL